MASVSRFIRDLDDHSPILRYHCNSALEFVRFLEPSGPVLRGGAWLYRGLSNAGYKLLPTVLRPEAEETIEAILGYECASPTYAWAKELNVFHMLREIEILSRFAEEIDSAGLPLPGPGSITISHLASLRRRFIAFLRTCLQIA
jgi:hypothetical protein